MREVHRDRAPARARTAASAQAEREINLKDLSAAYREDEGFHRSGYDDPAFDRLLLREGWLAKDNASASRAAPEAAHESQVPSVEAWEEAIDPFDAFTDRTAEQWRGFEERGLDEEG